MDVVLLERIDTLGAMGAVVSVKPGYARNYLIPQGKALRASKHNVARFEAERAEREAQNAEARAAAENISQGLAGTHVVLIRQASDNLQLYGSVKARDIADGLIAKGFEVDRANVVLDKPIKTLGLHEVKAALHPEVVVTVIANVARTADEAEVQEQLGRAVRRADAVEEAPEVEDLVEPGVAEEIEAEAEAEAEFNARDDDDA
ncbi:MAG: 50S ribosomal protein L9 [Proteobacteria bacterium]|nr:50S ribosomal protein L9 [Pseudomonadota bacterium]MDA1071258.1 50S ribosomal protein L9 [Pseudomonadota bacterium]